MGSTHMTSEIWSFFMQNERMQELLKGLLPAVEDPEERTFQIVCHTLFLLAVDIKKQRDEAMKKFDEVKSDASVCVKCKNGVDNDIEEIVLSSQSSSDNQASVILNTKVKNLPSFDIVNSRKEIQKTQRKADKKYRCLSMKSPRKKNGIQVLDVPEEDKADAVLVPETMSLDENRFHVNVEQRKRHDTQRVFVPETVAMDSPGESDFFESESISKKQTRYQGYESPKGKQTFTDQGYESPKGKQIFTDPETQKSPILGKKNHNTPKAYRMQEAISIHKSTEFQSPTEDLDESLHTPVKKKKLQRTVVSPKSCRKVLSINMPDPLEFKTPPKEPLKPSDINSPDKEKLFEKPPTLQIFTEDLNAGILVPQDASTPRYSPLQFTHALSSPSGENSFTSPSLLPSIKDGNKKATTTVSPKATRARSLKKSASTLSAVSSKENVGRLRRHQTEDKSSRKKTTGIELHIEPPDPAAKKKYKQARIFDMPLVPKTDVVKLTGGLPRMTFDDEVNAALKASLRTKEMEDMKRRGLEEDLHVAQTLQKEVGVGSKEDQFPINVKSPRKSSHESEQKESSPKKKLSKSPSESSIKNSKSLLKRSPKKSQCQNSEASFSKKENTDVHGNDDGVLELDKILEQVNQSPAQQETSKLTKKNSNELSPSTKRKKLCPEIICSPEKKRKREPLPSEDDSFDVLPEPEELNYAHQSDVVRKKAERKKLKGWSCKQCKNWFEDKDLPPEELQAKKDLCSRHRSKYNPMTNTPPGFWNPLWVDTSQERTQEES